MLCSTHLHIGAGQLGLGLIVHLLGLEPVIVNRDPQPKSVPVKEDSSSKFYDALKRSNRYLLHLHSAESMTVGEWMPYRSFYFSQADETEVVGCFEERNLVIVTTAVKSENLNALAVPISRWLQKRAQKDVSKDWCLFILACENLAGTSRSLRKQVRKVAGKNRELRDYINKCVLFLDCVVDRICWNREIEEIKHNGQSWEYASIHAESYGEWVINVHDRLISERLKRIDQVRQQESKGVIKLCEEVEFSFFEKRKQWLVTGIQLALALYAGSLHEKVGDALKNPVHWRKIQEIQESFGYALNYYGRVELELTYPNFPYVTMADITAYNAKILERLQVAGIDTFERLLSGDLQVKLAKRIFEPIRYFSKYKNDPRKVYLPDALEEEKLAALEAPVQELAVLASSFNSRK